MDEIRSIETFGYVIATLTRSEAGSAVHTSDLMSELEAAEKFAALSFEEQSRSAVIRTTVQLNFRDIITAMVDDFETRAAACAEELHKLIRESN